MTVTDRGFRERWCAPLVCGLVLASMQPVLVAAQAVGHDASAEASPPGSADANSAAHDALIAEASSEYAAQNYVEARALFRKAANQFATGSAFRGLGMSEYALRDYGDSIAALRRALACHVGALEGEPRLETERLLAQAESFVAQIQVSTEPSPATVLLDGAPVVHDEGAALVVEPGDHVIVFRAPGYGSERRVLSLRGGDRQSLRVVLLHDPSAASTPVDAPLDDTVTHDDRPPLRKNKWLWAGVGVAVAAVAVGLGVGLARRDAETAAPIAAGPAVVLGGP